METKPLIGIVIVNYNGQKFLDGCLSCIFKNTFTNYSVIIVDNKSTDKSIELLDKYDDPRIVKILCDDNFGVAKGNNIGIKKSIELGTKYTLLLNNDTLFDEKLFETMLAACEKHNVVVPKMYYPDSKMIWYYGGFFSKIRCGSHHSNMRKIDTKTKDLICDYAPTTCMLINNSIFEKIGFMDEDYFLYCDDTDFCFRMKKINQKIYVLGNTFIYHLVSQSSGGENSKVSVYYSSRNRYYFINKYKRDFLFTRWIYYSYKRLKMVLKSDKVMKKARDDFRNGRMGRCDSL